MQQNECDRLDWSKLRICSECGGDVHEHFGCENWDNSYLTWAHCHNCGKNFDTDSFYELSKCLK